MLTLLLETPGVGVVAPAVVDGTLSYVLDRYPRFNLTARMRPDPTGVRMWQSPYGTRAHVMKPDGSMMFTGPLVSSQITQPDGDWVIQAADDILLLRQYRPGNRPGQFLPGTTMTIKAFIEALAAMAGATVTVTGTAGLVDVRELDIAGAEAWSLVEEQLIANGLDCWPQGDGSLLIAPTAVMKPSADYLLTVGESGTITGYQLSMNRIYNRVVVTHEASKPGQADQRYIDGAWTDSTSSAGTAMIGKVAYTRTVRVGADWWDDTAGHQAQADANAAAVAQTIRGFARIATVDIVPDYRIKVGDTVAVTFMAGVTDRFLVAGASWPLAAGAVTLEVRNASPDWTGSTFFEQEAADAGIDT